MIVISHEQVNWEQFEQERTRVVLPSWPTGKDVDLTEAVAYHKTLPPQLNFAARLNAAQKGGSTLTQPRAGVADLARHTELLSYLQKEGGADLLSTSIDANTRRRLYAEAKQGYPDLHGFPAVNHGLAACRHLIKSLAVPNQVSRCGADARLLAEITLAGGFSSFAGGGISTNIPHTKRVPPAKSLRDWQYVDRLVGFYQKRGVALNRETPGSLTGILVAPCISHSIAIIEAVLAAKQGVKSITLSYGQGGHLCQDIAALQTLPLLARDYLQQEGLSNVQITTAFQQWTGGIPADEAKAYGIICFGALTAVLGGASKILVKSTREGQRVPRKEANARAIRATKQVLNMLRDQVYPESAALKEEREVIIRETRQILAKTLELGDGDWALGAVRAFAAGVIDLPFTPSTYNRGRTLPARDDQGAVRFLDCGYLPFSNKDKEFHRSKLAKRGRSEQRTPTFQMVSDDLYASGMGRLIGRPD